MSVQSHLVVAVFARLITLLAFIMSSSNIENNQVAQESIKKAPSARYLEGKRVDILSNLTMDLQHSVLRFLLQEPVPIANSRTLEAKQRLYGEFCTHHHTIAVVSKQWKTILGDFANMNAATRGDFKILTPRELSQLKSKVFALDLSTPLIRERFMDLARKEWERCVLSTHIRFTSVNEHLGTDVFVDMVEGEYKRFMVLKCVEKIASSMNLSEDALQWLEPSRPGCLVGLFWQAHREMAELYLEHCNNLVEGFTDPMDSPELDEECTSISSETTDEESEEEWSSIISCILSETTDEESEEECSSVSSETSDEETNANETNKECSSISEKHKVLFRFEQSFLKHNLTCSCRIAANDASLQRGETLMTRYRIFDSHFECVTEEEVTGYGIRQFDYCISCIVAGRTDLDNTLIRWGYQPPHECNGVCRKPCCPSCCTITNGFDPIPQSQR